MIVADILLVEDNPGDVKLIQKAFETARLANPLRVVRNGEDALRYLRKQSPFEGVETPHLVLLDLNLPGKDGREVLEEIKEDPELRLIPVVVLTSSKAHEDVLRSYAAHANSFVTKPPTLQELSDMVKSLHSYWFAIVRTPHD